MLSTLPVEIIKHSGGFAQQFRWIKSLYFFGGNFPSSYRNPFHVLAEGQIVNDRFQIPWDISSFSMLQLAAFQLVFDSIDS